MSGMRGDDEEHPANRRAVECISNVALELEEGFLQSKMIAIAIRIMRTWWYPRNGISPTSMVSGIPEPSVW